MKKLILNLDALEVDTFEPEMSASERPGSVVAHLASDFGDCATYDRQNFLCYASYIHPQAACTPVCGRTAQCVQTEDICIG